MFTSFEEAKKVADMITDKHNQFTVVYEFKVDEVDNCNIKDKIIYKTTIETTTLSNGLNVYNTKYY